MNQFKWILIAYIAGMLVGAASCAILMSLHTEPPATYSIPGLPGRSGEIGLPGRRGVTFGTYSTSPYEKR